MLKGCRKETIMVNTQESAFFECAFFVLRHSLPPAGAGEDMLREAARLVGQAPSARVRRRAKLGGRGLFLLVGLLAGALGTVIFMLLFF